MNKFLAATAVLATAVAVLMAVSLPPKRLALAARADGSVPGILHVHTNRSDGRAAPEDVAAAAASAGLKFIVFTDHGDATRPPDPPAYRSGVLCIDGVEISTSGGHYVALDLPAAPYPLAGEPRDVVEDVRRLGGFGIAAHPDSPKPELRWRDWDAPFDGIELLNPDTSWRVWARRAGSAADVPSSARWYARRRIAFSLLDYAVRPAETIARLMEPVAGEAVVSQWVSLTARRRVVTIAGIDAHGRVSFRGDPNDNGYALPVPGYAPAFHVLTVHVFPDQPLSGDAAADAARVVHAIRGGHLFTAVDGLATPASLQFTATSARGTAQQGDEIAAGGPATLRIRSNAPPGFTTTLWRNDTVASGGHHENDFSYIAPGDAAVYWVEIRAGDGPNAMVWIRSNPIYVRSVESPSRAPAQRPARNSRAIFDGSSTDAWHVEHDTQSAAAIDLARGLNANELRFRFGLAGGSPGGQFLSAVYDVQPDQAIGDRLTFTARAERPMRVSIQLRGGERMADRWQRSVYLDATEREHTVYFDDCLPVGTTRTTRAPLTGVRSVMFVVDTTNTKPGTSSRIWIRHAALEQ